MYKLILFVQLCAFCSIFSSTDASIFDSVVSVNREDNGDKKVGVHLPFIYWMDLNRNKEGPKLDISVLGGLVKVNVDRKKVNGRNPVMVRLLGAKIFNSYPNNYGQSSYDQTEESSNLVSAKPTSEYNGDKSNKVIAQESVVTVSKVAAVPITESSTTN